MNLFNQLLNHKLSNYELVYFILLITLPLSFVMANSYINLNIILIDLMTLFYCFRYKYWQWLNNRFFLHLFLIYLYLILNSIYSYFSISNTSNESLLRSVFFIKFILLVLSFQIIFKNKVLLSAVFKTWLLIILIFIFDVFFEKTFGQNITGNLSPDKTRIVSFFKDELVVGAFLLCFGFTTVSYFLQQNQNLRNKIFFTILLLLIPVAIFLSGERSNFIKSILLLFFILFFIQKNKIYTNKKVFLCLFIFLISIILFTNKSTFQKYNEFFQRIHAVDKKENLYKKFENIKYFAHYETAISIFKNYPLLGVGNKNFRQECSEKKYFRDYIKFTESRCSTHPHQIHFEILSEHGIIGYLLILSFMLVFFIKNFKIYIKTKNVYHLSCLGYLILFFTPLLPGAGIFSTFSGSMFWIVFAMCNLRKDEKKN